MENIAFLTNRMGFLYKELTKVDILKKTPTDKIFFHDKQIDLMLNLLTPEHIHFDFLGNFGSIVCEEFIEDEQYYVDSFSNSEDLIFFVEGTDMFVICLNIRDRIIYCAQQGDALVPVCESFDDFFEFLNFNIEQQINNVNQNIKHTTIKYIKDSEKFINKDYFIEYLFC